MTTVFTDSRMPDERRRERLYGGDLFVTSPSPAVQALVDFARELIEDAFAPYDPVVAQHELPVEKFVEIFGPLKPKFIHHPKTKGLIADVVSGLGSDLDETYIDVPRLRGATSDGYLTAGVGYAFPLHRDVWWSAPLAQINWWLPIYDFESESSMAFHPHYWSSGISNGSEEFNYYVYNATGRAQAAQHVAKDTRKQPGPREPVQVALDRAEHLRPHPVQHRLPHGERRRPAGRSLGAERRHPVRGHQPARLPARQRPGCDARGGRRPVRQRRDPRGRRPGVRPERRQGPRRLDGLACRKCRRPGSPRGAGPSCVLLRK